MIIADYFQAFKQASFVSEGEKQRVYGAFSAALRDYMQNPTSGDDAAVNKLDRFYFPLSVEDAAQPSENLLAISQINQNVLGIELQKLFDENGISSEQAVTFRVDKFGQLVAERHEQSQQIMQLLQDHPELQDRLTSALSDTSIAAHDAHQELIDAQIGKGYRSGTKRALIQEKGRSIPPRAELTLQNGKISASYSGMSLTKWIDVQQTLLASLITDKEAEQWQMLQNIL